MNKKHFLIFNILLALSISGCNSSNKEEPFTPTLDKETKCVISVKGHYDNFEALDEQIIKFNSYYPKVEVRYDKVDNYTKDTTLNNLFAGDDAPDIYFVTTGWENDSRYTMLFDHAEDLSNANLGIDTTVIRDALIYKDKNGKIPMLPIFTNTYGMIVNEDLLAKHHLSIPKTYNQLISVCDSLVKLGYTSPVMSYKASLYSLYFPYFLSTINNNKTAIDALNSLEASAGSYIRDALEKTNDFMSHKFIDKDKCTSEIEKDNTDSICYRFYKGDVPFIFTEVNRLSGSNKRESKSEEYLANPFKYSFQPVPSSDNSGYYFNTISLSFAVNKDSKNLEMTNEFMRFLIRSQSLNEMSSNKRQISPSKVLGDDKLFNSFKDVLKSNRVLYNSTVGLSNEADTQVRKTFDAFLNGASIDIAIASYGSY